MVNASGIEIRLSKAQQRAYDRLTDEWQSAYELQERLDTLDILVTKGLADCYAGLGLRFFPQRAMKYRLKK
jgi:hypothetical protein